jgi:hypothetical protein
MKTAEDLRAFYRTVLRDDLREVEALRSAARNQTLLAILGGIAVGLSAALFTSIHLWAIVPAVTFLILTIVLGVKARKRYKYFHGKLKQRVIGSIIRFLDPAFTYRPDGHIPQSRYEESGIFKTGVDRYRGDDLVSGSIDETAFVFSELHTEYKTRHTDSKGNSRTEWHTIFKGLFFCADFNKHFKGTTYVLPDTAERLFGFLGSTLQGWKRSHGDLVKLEDPEFEKEFVVYGSDQIEARYILSPGLMERIVELKKKAGRKIHLSFVQSWVNLAIEFDKDLFEAPLFGSALDYPKVRDYFRDLQLAFGIVEDLNLNTRIWTKT